MTDKEKRELVDRINKYADSVLPEKDPAKVPIRVQLEALKPEMEKIAKEKNMAIEDIFIEYMDMNAFLAAQAEQKFQEEMEKSLGSNPYSGLNKE